MKHPAPAFVSFACNLLLTLCTFARTLYLTVHPLTEDTTMSQKLAVTLDQVLDAIKSGEYVGFCIVCGAESYGVEPDARKCPCEVCEHNTVYGAEELLFSQIA